MIEATADQPEGNGPQCDVVDHPGLAAAGLPASVTDQQRHHYADDDAQRVGANRHRAEMPDAARRAGEIYQPGCCHDCEFPWRTPPASSSVRARNAARPLVSALTSADPTMTPSV